MINHPKMAGITDKIATPACYFGPAVMIVADFLTITLNPGVNPVQESISHYAALPFGWLERIGMFFIALSFLFIASPLLRIKNTKENHWLKAAGILLLIVAAGFLMLSIFNTNVIATIISFHGFVHQVSSVAVSVVFYLACLILMRYMIKKQGLTAYGVYNGITFLVGVVALTFIIFNYHDHEIMGFTERLIAGFNLVWIVLVGPRVIKVARFLQ